MLLRLLVSNTGEEIHDMLALGLEITPPDFDHPDDEHEATQWRVFWHGMVVYESEILESSLLEHTAEIPDKVGNIPIGIGKQYFYISFRVRGSVSGWSRWSALEECFVDLGFKPPIVFDRGPVELNDVSRGLNAKLWKLELRDAFYLARQEESQIGGWRDVSHLFDPTSELDDISNVSFTFDQNGRPVVFYEVSGQIKGYYYDGVAGEFDVWDVGGGRTPVAKLEYRRKEYLPDSDILLFYIRSDGHLCYRSQSDRYDTEYETGLTGFENSYLKQLDNTKDARLCLTYITEGPGYGSGGGDAGDCFTFGFCVSKPYPIIYDEELSVSSETRSGSRRQAILFYTAEEPETFEVSSKMVGGSRRQMVLFYTPEAEILEVSSSMGSGSRRVAVSLYPFESQKETPYLTESSTDGVDPEDLSQTDRQGLELMWVESTMETSFKRKAVIEVDINYPSTRAQLEVSSSMIGGSRNDKG